MSKRFYNGQGKRNSEPLILPTINHDIQTTPEGYLATADLAAAVDTALTLGMPLLLTGEPGSGKSALAKSIAWEVLGENEKPLEFTVKSDTRATDLFYRFDTVGRFHAANAPDGEVSAKNFLHFNAMGRAILQAKPFKYTQDLLQSEQRAQQVHTGEQKRSVVLIDEIDKAPRDVPNDMLVELERLCFDIHELQTLVELEGDECNHQPIIIITSNSEKALPEAFLRRCVYHHLEFPAFDAEEGNTVTVRDIVDRRLGNRFTWEEGLLKDAISWFKFLRQVRGIEKKPSMAEFLSWLEYLQATNPHATELNPDSVQLQQSISHVLLKKSQDQDQAQCKQWLSQWKAED
ncbi:AAA family ATPase [Leucothrix arctica]|uniref:ATPase n=1 Tax=Leucothrix arctica TaxID=1481894 RepID=A0A317C873_9GAMM|nr:MoxR family ATPase [Leucothrix arctica]PWQ94774.1 ATPase [Leucothrix arctica]